MDNGKIARIVPATSSESGVTRAQGTQVMVGDVAMTGITRIELVCEVGDMWRARIDCHVQPPADLSALAAIYYPTRWQRIKRWLAPANTRGFREGPTRTNVKRFNPDAAARVPPPPPAPIRRG